MNATSLAASLSSSFDDPVKEKLLGILGAGVPQTAAALACGVSDGYVSQLMDDPEFAQALAARKSKKVEAAIKYEDTVESVRDKALGILDAKLAYVKSPMEAARIFQILDSARRTTGSGTGTQDNQPLGIQQVAVVLPKAAQVLITMNAQNQVIDVQGRSMATLPSRSLPALSKEQSEKKDALRLADQTAAGTTLAGLAATPAALKKVPNVFTAEDL